MSWNNRGVVGISVIGNFEKDVLVKEQKQSLEKFLTVLSQKYGINTNTTITGHRACKVSEECLTRDFDIKSLVGHRDVGFTSCPGTNLYAELTNNLIPKLNKVSKNNILVANTVYKPETLIKPTSLTKPKTNIGQPTPNVPENFGPMIRIRLSVPKSKTLELEATE